jgi:hypothetical protein
MYSSIYVHASAAERIRALYAIYTNILLPAATILGQLHTLHTYICSAFMKRRRRKTRGCSPTNVACPTAVATRHHLSLRMESRTVLRRQPCLATPSNSQAMPTRMRVWSCTMQDYSPDLKSALCFGRTCTHKASTGPLLDCGTTLIARVTAIFISGWSIADTPG